MNSLLESGTVTLVEALQDRYKDWDGVNQLDGTAERLVRLYDELCWPQLKVQSELDRVFKSFDHNFHEMVVGGPFLVYILCPHHLLPCRLEVFVGYIPNTTDGKVLGLSKLARMADILGRRPILQEQYTEDIVDVLESRLKPKGSAVSVTGVHGCMTARGVRQERGQIVTSTLKGDFLTDPSTRDEFYSIVRK